MKPAVTYDHRRLRRVAGSELSDLYRGRRGGAPAELNKLIALLDVCVSSLRRGRANLPCIVPILTDDPRRESRGVRAELCSRARPPRAKTGSRHIFGRP